MECRPIVFLALLAVLGCRDVRVPEVAPDAESTTQIDSVMQPGTAPGEEEDCARSLCGCWEDRALTYANTIVDDVTEDPLQGITLTCFGDEEPMATSDVEGGIAFEIQTRFSPGCKYERCTNLRFEDPSGEYEAVERTVYQRETTRMERSASD